MDALRLRRLLSRYHAFMCAAIFCVVLTSASGEAGIIDVGEVFVEDGTLVVAGSADGTRVNLDSPDGPYQGLIVANGFSTVAIPNFGAATAPVTGALIMSGRRATLGVDGPGGLGGRTVIGYNGNGTLVLSDGATVTPTGPSVGVLGWGGPAVAADTPVSPSHGTVVVSGSETQWTTGTLRIGLSGTAALTITDGGAVNANGNATAGFVLPSIIGTFSGASGAVTVAGHRSTLGVVDRLGVADGNPTRGNFGPATGVLNIVNGGFVTSAGATIGNFGPARGAVPAIGVANIDGRGSRWDLSGPAPLGFTRIPLDVGRSGNGTVNVTNGGHVVVDGWPGAVPGSMLNVGFQQASTGMVVVSGSGSRLDVQGPSDATQTELIDGVPLSRVVVGNVGYNGRGQLHILDNAQMTISGRDALTGAPAGFLNIGRNPGSEGNVVVNGMLRVATAIGIGTPADLPPTAAQPGGVGTLNVAKDGKVRTQEIRVGPDGTLTGDGSIIGNVVNAGGVIRPRGLAISGDFAQQAGVLLFDISGDGSAERRACSKPRPCIASPSRESLMTVTGAITIADGGAIAVRVAAAFATGTVLNVLESGRGDVLTVVVSGTKFLPIGTGVFERLLAAHPNLVQVAVVPELPTQLLFAGTIGAAARGAGRCC